MGSNTALHNLNQEPLEGLCCLAHAAVNLKARGSAECCEKRERDAMVSVWFAHPETPVGV